MIKHEYDKKSVWNMGEIRRRGRNGALIFIKRMILGLIRKKSYVLTCDKEVIYHQHRLSLFKHNFPSFAVYYIRIIQSLDQWMDSGYVIHGEIDTEFLYDDHESIYGRNIVNRIVIPPCFVDMNGIGQALKSLCINSSKT